MIAPGGGRADIIVVAAVAIGSLPESANLMGKIAYYCNECSNIVTSRQVGHGEPLVDSESGEVVNCPHGDVTPLNLSRTAFLIGLPGTGKTSYLVSCFRMLNRSRDWTVVYDDHAFERMIRDEARMQYMDIPPTPEIRGVHHPYTCIRVAHLPSRTKFAMVSVDESGKCFTQMRNNPREWDDQGLGWLLRHCPAVLVTLMCGEPNRDMDRDLGQLFHMLIKRRSSLRRVIVMLTGADRLGGTVESACEAAHRAFVESYHIFPGVLKNARIPFEPIPLSNVGVRIQERIYEPFNTAEPLQRLVAEYQPWWKRWGASWLASQRQAPVAQTTSFAPVERHRPVAQAAARGRVFISYRREGGAETARLIRGALQERGWTVFLDVEDLDASFFDERLLGEIARAENFLVVLSPGSLDHCHSPHDWLRREIGHALHLRKTVVPVLKAGFSFPSAERLPEDLRDLPRRHGISYTHEYFAAFIDKLESLLVR